MSERARNENDASSDDDAEQDEPEPDDSKMYTGEPVETHRGREVPQQMNVGRDNMEGGGEWPDPRTPPRQ
jgi:hypothetical protein